MALQAVRLHHSLYDPVLTSKQSSNVRGYYFGHRRASFVDVMSVHHLTHDFSESDLSAFFDDEELDLHIKREDIFMLEGYMYFAVYWTEDESFPVNKGLYERTGIEFHGKLLVFKRRQKSMRYSHLTRNHLANALEGVSW